MRQKVDVPWTDEMLDRFMVAEVCIDELMQIGDEFPGYFTPEIRRALEELQRGPYQGFADEPRESRARRMRATRDKLDRVFPCNHRTEFEKMEGAKP